MIIDEGNPVYMPTATLNRQGAMNISEHARERLLSADRRFGMRHSCEFAINAVFTELLFIGATKDIFQQTG